jgi:Xaa-Pro aminopeptidase
MDYFAIRRGNLLKTLKGLGAESFLATHEQSVRYLTGFTGGSSLAFISAKNTVLISDERFTDQVREECPTIDALIRKHDRTTPEAAAEVMMKSGVKSVAFEANHLDLTSLEFFRAECPKLNFAPANGEVEKLRAIKDASEVEQIRHAVRTAERAFTMFAAMIRDQDTEKDMADAMEMFLRRSGARGSAFPTIVAVGERGALPHAVPTNRTLTDASKLLVDFGADCGYKSDLTRTLRSPFGQNPNRKNRMERIGHNLDEIHAIVLAAQNTAAAAIRPGVPVKDVDTAARSVIHKAGYGDYFNHGLGHGIGLDVHELPRVRQNSDDVLEMGMVITLEPGIYIPEWGGCRIEDDFLVSRDGAIQLSTLTKDVNISSTPVIPIG